MYQSSKSVPNGLIMGNIKLKTANMQKFNIIHAYWEPSW